MVNIFIKNNLSSFESDIRDLCLAFFPMSKINFVYTDKCEEHNETDGKNKIVNETIKNDVANCSKCDEFDKNNITKNKLIENSKSSIKESINENNKSEVIETEKIGRRKKHKLKMLENNINDVQDNVNIEFSYDGDMTRERIEVKGDIKRQLYKYLYSKTGKRLLWGTLTGIRPVTIVTNLIEKDFLHLYSDDNKNQEKTNPKTIGNNVSDNSSNKDIIINKNGSKNYSDNSESSNIINDTQNCINEEYHKLSNASLYFDENGNIKKNYAVKIKNYLQNEYYLSSEKCDELINIAAQEIKILQRKDWEGYANSYSIYVGVPFCKSTCLYCSFTSFNIDKYKDYVGKYLTALENEFKSELHYERFAPSNKNGNQRIYSPMTLYVGGGTPTSLDEESFERFLTIIDKYIYKKTLVEYTIEAGRPDTITEKKLLSMKKHGVARISINPQSFNQKTLDLIGRKHKVEDVIEKIKLARALGFDNINMDMILGLPNEHLFDVIKTLNQIRKIKPESLTVHSLALKRAARLNYELDSWTKNYYLAGLDEGKVKITEKINHDEIDEKMLYTKKIKKRIIDKMFEISAFIAKCLKLKPYYLYRQKNMAGNLENVGYTKEGLECVYNIMMMSERHTVFGFGCATTKQVYYENGGKRIESIEGYKSVVDYCKKHSDVK